MVKVFVYVYLMGIGSITFVTSKVSVAHQLLEFTHSSYFRVPWEVNIIVPVM